MKCDEPKPGDSWRTCERDLKHSGPHMYLNESWPRPEPSEPAPDVQALLDRTRPSRCWGVDERRYPIVVVETVTRVLWVDAESEDDAIAYWANDYSDIDLQGAHVLEGDLEFRRLDEFERSGLHSMPLRKCHGPIEWTETKAPNPKYRWSRKFQKTPIGGIREQVAA